MADREQWPRFGWQGSSLDIDHVVKYQPFDAQLPEAGPLNMRLAAGLSYALFFLIDNFKWICVNC